MQIGMIGLGRMGANMSRRLARGGHSCVLHDVRAETVHAVAAAIEGSTGAVTLDDLVAQLAPPRVVWLMVPAGVVDATLGDLCPRLAPGDIVIDGGNSFYADDIRRAGELRAAGLHYLDVGTSGGVFGLERGYCLMIGGEAEVVTRLGPLFETLAPPVGSAPPTPRPPGQTLSSTAEHGYLHCGPSGAGHFVKMVHNGIEYGVMAAYAEGLAVLRHADAGDRPPPPDAETTPLRHPEHYRYDLPIPEIAEVWRRGSVISSWLLDLTAAALRSNGDLAGFSGRVSDSGEGRWTVQAAIDLETPTPVIASALFSRFASRGEAEYADKLLSALRFQFGGHQEKPSESATPPTQR